MDSTKSKSKANQNKNLNSSTSNQQKFPKSPATGKSINSFKSSLASKFLEYNNSTLDTVLSENNREFVPSSNKLFTLENQTQDNQSMNTQQTLPQGQNQIKKCKTNDTNNNLEIRSEISSIYKGDLDSNFNNNINVNKTSDNKSVTTKNPKSAYTNLFNKKDYLISNLTLNIKRKDLTGEKEGFLNNFSHFLPTTGDLLADMFSEGRVKNKVRQDMEFQKLVKTNNSYLDINKDKFFSNNTSK